MASQKLFAVSMLQMLLVTLVFNLANAQLKYGFYKETCPLLEHIVWQTTAKYINTAPTLAAPILRMSYHDCFVNGCDASLLINSTKNNVAEKDSLPNVFLRGFQIIDAAKAAIEKACPGIVSCSDILTIVVRDAVALIHGPHWEVELGRRDGRVSNAAQALAILPAVNHNISALKSIFKANGLTSKDLAVLSGAHTIGIGHCFLFTNRLYNFTGKGDSDPTLDSEYVPKLKSKCKATVVPDLKTFVEMDPGSFKTFDTSYFRLVSKRRGLFQSDAALLDDAETKSYVKQQASTYGATFYKDFAESMVRMSRIGILTGKAGEIRKHCALVN